MPAHFYFSLNFLCMNVPVCMSVYHVCTWCLERQEKGTVSPGTGVTGDGELAATWVLGTILRSSGRAASVLSC